MEESDFWWLPKDVDPTTLSMCVGHHKPLTDDDDPRGIQWFHSLKNGDLVAKKEYYPLDFVHAWRKACNNTNIYRTLKLFKQKKEPFLLGPFLIDIDNSQSVNGYQEDLADALNVARNTVKLLNNNFNIRDGDLHVFFSGRKGFNIEVCPAALKVSGSVDNQTKLFAKKLDCIIKALRRANNVTCTSINAVSNKGTVIDRIYGDRFGYKLKHPYVRLHHSINKWITNTETEVARMRIQLSLDELMSSDVDVICRRSESLALNRLESP